MSRLAPGRLGLALTIFAACGSDPPSAGSRLGLGPPPERTGVIPGPGSGATRIDFVSADPPAGTTVSGCGSDARGCPGRLRMVFRLTPSATGTASRFVATLSAADRPCFRAAMGPVPLQAQAANVVQAVLDPVESCPTPFSVAALTSDLEGDGAVAAHQEWTIGYTFAP